MIFEHGVRYEYPYPMLFTKKAFPWEIYREIVRHLPEPSFYVPNTHGGHCGAGRSSLSLKPARIDPLPLDQRHFWTCMREILHDRELMEHVCGRLDVSPSGLHPFACLLRDTEGYTIGVHPDWDMKVVTVQCYLPAVDDIELRKHGTDIYDTQKRHARTVPYMPNAAYAFKRTDTSYHGVLPIPKMQRDSLMITYCREPWDEF